MRIDIGDGTRLFFDVVGAGLEPTPEKLTRRPTLLLLHGGPGGDHSAFRPYFDRFGDTHQVVYLDHHGNGRSDSDGDHSLWNLDTWADDVVRFCEALEITKPVVLGLSFGGFVGIRYASRHPGHAAKLILSSTAARRDTALSEERFRALGGDRAAQLYRRFAIDGDCSVESLLEYLAVNMPLYNRQPSGFGPARTRMNLDVLDHFTQSWSEMDLRSDVAQITTPTLVVGGLDDPMTPPESSREIFDLLPEGLGRLTLFEDCGHGSFRDRPEATETLLREFLAE